MKLDLWVRLNITMADDNKVSGWTQIYGKHELAMYKKPFKSLKPIVNDHIERINWLTICNRWGETNQVIEVNTSKIKKYIIKECVQPYDTEEQITLPKVKRLLPCEPIIGQRRGKTIWLVFFKQ